MADTFHLPSGGTIDVNRPDFSVCRNAQDFSELKYVLQEKIIDIEFQIEMFECGAGISEGRTYAVDWKPRANAALKWAKLYRDECQNRQGQMSNREKAERQLLWDRQIIDVVKGLVTKEQFEAIIGAANALRHAVAELPPAGK